MQLSNNTETFSWSPPLSFVLKDKVPTHKPVVSVSVGNGPNSVTATHYSDKANTIEKVFTEDTPYLKALNNTGRNQGFLHARPLLYN